MMSQFINPEMIMFILKQEMDNVLSGKKIDGFEIKENENVITLTPTKKFTDTEIKSVSGEIKIEYKNKLIKLLL